MRMERQLVFWVLAAVLFVLIIALIKDVLLPFVLGALFAYGLNPVANALERLGLSRFFAALLLVAGLVLTLLLLLIFLVPVFVEQVHQLALALPGELERLKAGLDAFFKERLGERTAALGSQIVEGLYGSLASSWSGVAQHVAESAWTYGRTLFNVLSLLLITPLVVFYLLVDWHPMLRKIDSWLPRDHAARIRQLGHDVNVAVGAFIRGQGLVCLILGTFYAIGLSLVGLDYGLLIGVATGLAAFVPLVGWILGTITGVTLALIQFWPQVTPVLLVFSVFLAGVALDTGVLAPKIVGKKIGLHPVWLIFALFAFSYLFGVVGVLVAVPLAAAVGVVVRFALDLYLESSVYTGQDKGSDEKAASSQT